MFDLDWTDISVVLAYAKKMRAKVSVIKLPERANYNIVHTANLARYPRAVVVMSF